MNEKLSKLKSYLSDQISSASNPVLWWSGGNESTLLLTLMQGLEFSILRFDDLLTRAQKQYSDNLIASLNLKVFAYPAKEIYFIGKRNEVSAVFEIPLADGSTVPLIRDCIKGTKCAIALDIPKVAIAPIYFDLQIVGSRKKDVHYAFDGIKQEFWQVGKSIFSAPLHDWDRRQVNNALRYLGVELPPNKDSQNTGNLEICTKCLLNCKTVFCPMENKRIPTIEWNRDLMTEKFRGKFEE